MYDFVTSASRAAFMEGLTSYAQQVDMYCSLAASVIYTALKRISTHLLRYLIAVVFFLLFFLLVSVIPNIWHSSQVRLDFFVLP